MTPIWEVFIRSRNGLAISHTSGNRMGTDWRDNDPKLEPVGMCRMCLVEVWTPRIDPATRQVVLGPDGQPQMALMMGKVKISNIAAMMQFAKCFRKFEAGEK